MTRERWALPHPRWLGMPLVREWGVVDRSTSGELSLHRNNGFEITYTEAGEYVWELEGGRQLTLSGGQIGLTQPETNHRGEHDRISPGRLFFLVINPWVKGALKYTPFTGGELKHIGSTLAKGGDMTIQAHASLPRLFTELGKGMERFSQGTPPPLLKPTLRGLICQVLLGVEASLTTSAIPKESAPIARARHWMTDHFADDFTMEEVAHAAGLNRSRFYQTFKAEVGQTPTLFLTRYRLSRAGRSLRESGKSIAEIAVTHGFTTSQYFATTFRKLTGLSPGEYRRRYRRG